MAPSSIWQLYLACVTSAADYGSVIWWRGQISFLDKVQKLQNKALRKILGAFKTSPILTMEIEAALAPPKIRLESNIRQFALRLAKLPQTHPVNHEMERIEEREIFPGPYQICRIKRMLVDLFDPQYTEKLQHFKFPPWKNDALIEVNIENKNKEDSADHLKEIIRNEKRSKTTLIFTDASRMKKSLGIGIRIYIEDLFSKNRSEFAENIADSQQVHDGELEAITQAIEYASRKAQLNQKFIIFSDNQAAIRRISILNNMPGQSQVLRAQRFSKIVAKMGAKITIHWVPGHFNIEGNNIADKLAKNSSLQTPHQNITSFNWIKQQVRNRKFESWSNFLREYDEKNQERFDSYRKKFDWKVKSRMQLPKGTRRQVASTLFQFKLGHGFFKTYLHRMGHSNTDLCCCGQKETPEHVLLWCKKHSHERKILKEELYKNQLSMKLLSHIKAGITMTLTFIEKTGIGTRKWHLSRQERNKDD